MNGCSAAVDRHRHGHVLDDEFMDRLHAEVGESENTGRPDRLGYEIGRAADRDEVGGAVSLDGLDRRWATLGFANHDKEARRRQHRLGEPVHARRCRRASGSNDLVSHGGDRAHLVDRAIPEVDRQPFAFPDHGHESRVSCVAAGQQAS